MMSSCRGIPCLATGWHDLLPIMSLPIGQSSSNNLDCTSKAHWMALSGLLKVTKNESPSVFTS